MIKFDNTYVHLPENFYQKVLPSAGEDVSLIKFNQNLAKFLNIDFDGMSEQELAEVFSGKKILEGSEPIAMAYAAHQFGHHVPQLGDGRAILLGEVIAKDNHRYDIQLKGAGQTKFSRRGDGRSWLGPVIREYIVSEAMFSLGIPTTRALAAVDSGEEVYREDVLPGGIFTRVASSHIRVGTFEYFANQGLIEDLKRLADYTIERHYPNLKNDYNAFFEAVAKKKLDLVAKWMGVGFIHGVMNTDNTSICGETIDYGPCAFMDQFSFHKVFSSIDHHGRYAYSNQGKIAVWNLSVLANSLFPLLKEENESDEEAIERIKEKFEELSLYFESQWLKVMSLKFGIINPKAEDKTFINDFLKILEKEKLDFTNSFRALCDYEFFDKDFIIRFKNRLKEQNINEDEASKIMMKNNPFIIPRNHQVEKAIQEAINGQFDHFHLLNKALLNPYDENKEFKDLTLSPKPEEVVHQTFCGT